MYLYRTLIGFVLTNDNNAVRKFYVYEGGYKEAIETNEIIERNGLPKNLENFLTEFKNEEILVIDPNLFEALKSKNYKAKLVTINEEISKFVTSLKDFS